MELSTLRRRQGGIALDINLRLEKPEDHRLVEELTREAFWGTNNPGCDEHFLVHKLRTVSAFVPELDFVAEVDGKIVGNIMYSDAKEAAEYDKSFPHKEMAVLESIDVLLEKLATPAQMAIREHGVKTLAGLNRVSGREVGSWPGIDETAKTIINTTLLEHGHHAKAF